MSNAERRWYKTMFKEVKEEEEEEEEMQTEKDTRANQEYRIQNMAVSNTAHM